MRDYLILAESETTARALGCWLELMGEPSLTEVKGRINDHRCILDGGSTPDQGVRRFEYLAARIEVAVIAAGCRSKVVVLVDAVRAELLNPLQEGGSWDNIVAMLILAFPEVRWFFGLCSENGGVDGNADIGKGWIAWHSLPALCTHVRRDPLLDGTGLRQWVRSLANVALDANAPITKFGGSLPLRKQAAAAIDEEPEFASFHAYSAYRFGFRADIVASWKLMELLFGERAKGNHGYDLLFEDINLQFPDRPEGTRLSDFEQDRTKHCESLGKAFDKARHRIIVSTGYAPGHKSIAARNLAYIRDYKGSRSTALVPKPVGGIYDLWSRSRLAKRLRSGPTRGQADGFVWPPHERMAHAPRQHSAPGKLMLISRHLVRRAENLRSCANTVDEFIRGAVLATEALELVGYLTPTLAEQALLLRHEFEVRTEVAFIGAGYHFEIKKRLDELEEEAKCAARFYHGAHSQTAQFDMLVSIGTRLTIVFQEAGHFEEEQACACRVRHWNNSLWMARKPMRYIYWPLVRYFELLLSSMRVFCAAILIWVLGLTFSFELVEKLGLPKLSPGGQEKLGLVINSFFGGGNFLLGDVLGNLLITVAVVSGVAHLGVFVSHMYSIVSRK